MICITCNKEFFEDWRAKGKAQRRPLKYCSFSCSHARKHTQVTRDKISESLRKKTQKFCEVCSKVLDRRNGSGVCKSCRRSTSTPSLKLKIKRQKMRHSIKKVLVEYKGGKCIKCGYNKCLGALEFHHRNPEEKDFAIGGVTLSKKLSLDDKKKELDKCDLLCANCHREIHEHWNFI